MLKPRARERKRAKQGAKRPVSAGLELERYAAVRARRARVEKGVNLLLEEVALQGAEQLFGLGQSQPEGSCWISGSWICRGHPIALLSLFPPSCPYFSKAFLRLLHFRDNVGA